MLRGKQLWFLEKFGHLLPDSLYLRWKFRLLMGVRLHLRHPVTYSEKLQWLKLNDRNPLYHTLADKLAVKDYVAGVAGREMVIPTLGVWDRACDIDFDSLPGSFVLKCTHDSGSTVVCRDSAAFDREEARRRLDEALSRNYWFKDREWAYKGLTPRIIAEPMIDDDPADYKFFCFDGVPRFMFLATDRGREDSETRFDFFDMDFNHLPFTNGHPNADSLPAKPALWEEMKETAARLSAGIPHVRIDLYEVGGRIYFGEYTFYHWAGFKPFDPPEWDAKIGDWIR